MSYILSGEEREFPGEGHNYFQKDPIVLPEWRTSGGREDWKEGEESRKQRLGRNE